MNRDEVRPTEAPPGKPTVVEPPAKRRMLPPQQPLEKIFSYKSLEDEIHRVETSRVWPPVEEVEQAYRKGLLKVLERRRELLFSVPVSPKAQKDRNEAWKALEFKEGMGIFVPEQHHYAKSLLKSYATAPPIEQLVIWDLVRLRMRYSVLPDGRRGMSNIDNILTRFEMARLLFSALGVDKSELFEAIEPKVRVMSSEAGLRGSRAEEEIERLHLELEKEAEKILEDHWKPK